MKSTNRIQMQNVVPTETGATLCISYIPAHDRRQTQATTAALLSGGAASRRPWETVDGRGGMMRAVALYIRSPLCVLPDGAVHLASLMTEITITMEDKECIKPSWLCGMK
jgi:energy-converting hydrogenase Eha subunit B